MRSRSRWQAGVIDVSKCGCTITAATAGLHDQLRAIGEDWALGQWLAFNGTFAFHGATLEREDSASRLSVLHALEPH